MSPKIDKKNQQERLEDFVQFICFLNEFSTLTEDEKKLLAWRFYCGETLERCAELFGGTKQSEATKSRENKNNLKISRQAVDFKLKIALEKIKKRCNLSGISNFEEIL